MRGWGSYKLCPKCNLVSQLGNPSLYNKWKASFGVPWFSQEGSCKEEDINKILPEIKLKINERERERLDIHTYIRIQIVPFAATLLQLSALNAAHAWGLFSLTIQLT